MSAMKSDSNKKSTTKKSAPAKSAAKKASKPAKKAVDDDDDDELEEELDEQPKKKTAAKKATTGKAKRSDDDDDEYTCVQKVGTVAGTPRGLTREGNIVRTGDEDHLDTNKTLAEEAKEDPSADIADSSRDAEAKEEKVEEADSETTGVDVAMNAKTEDKQVVTAKNIEGEEKEVSEVKL